MARIFVSYSRVDYAFTKDFVDRLREMFPDHTVWWDNHLLGGDVWWDEILKQIAVSDIFIYLLSNESVTSPYCHAEFSEARRLQKRIITVQVRDRTKLTDDLSDIQYVDMKAGVDDARAQARLVAAVNKQVRLIPARRPRPLSPERTPRPTLPDEKPRPAHDADVDTPTLRLTDKVMLSSPQVKQQKPDRRALIAGAVVFMFVIVLAVAALLPSLLNTPDNSLTETAEAATQLALALTPTITPMPSITATDAPTLTPTPTLEIAFVVQTLDAQATIDQATAYVLASAAARATAYAVGTQSAVDQTATATLWTDTPTPNITASIEAYRTQQAATNTAQFIVRQTATAASWTDTPMPTNTPTDTAMPTATLTPTLSPEQIALTPVSQNANWQPFERDFEGVTMVLVPAGCFMMGSDDGQDDEKPVHEQCFDEPFWLDKTEVTNAQFAAFNGTAGRESNWAGDNRPRERITWFEARDFCAQRGARLPTEAEWEYAARGPNALVYPWGNNFVADNVVYRDNSGSRTADIGKRPASASWVGALDLSGNVWEWVSSLYEDYPYNAPHESNADNNLRVLRGGSWNDGADYLRAADRGWGSPDNWDSGSGFRCARDFE